MNMNASVMAGMALIASSNQRNLKRDLNTVIEDYNAVTHNLNAEKKNHKDFVFRAKGHVHALRAINHARQVTEDQLIAALKAENANHPLASKEAVEAAVEDARVRAIVNPEVIKRTYPDGKLPDGVVTGSPPVVELIA